MIESSEESFEAAADEALDTDDEASVFSRWETLETIKEKFRMKDTRTQRRLVNEYNDTIDRRDFLKILGLTAGATYVAANGVGFLMGKKVFSDHTDRTITGMASGCDYETIPVDPGENRLIPVEEGEVFENVIIDITADGAGARLYPWQQGDRAGQSEWTIRNVGFEGVHESGDYPLAPGCTGEGLVENVYIGDGTAAYPSSNESPHPGACWVPKEHSGHVVIRNLYMEGWVDNGLYGSAPGFNGQGGTILVENSYAKNCSISCFRLGGEDTIRNCYGMSNDSNPGNHRGLWVYEGGANVTVEDCHFDTDVETSNPLSGDAFVIGSGSTANVSNTQYADVSDSGTLNDDGGNGNNPEEFVPEGCPEDPEQAACGEGSAGGAPGGASGGGPNEMKDC